MKNQMKKIFLFTCALVLALSMMSCVKPPTTTKDPVPSVSASPSPSPSPEVTQKGELTITPTPTQPGDATETIGDFVYWVPSELKKMEESGVKYYYTDEGSFLFTSTTTHPTGIDSSFMTGYRMGIVSYQTDRITYENKITINDMDVYQYVYTADVDATTEAHAFTYAIVKDTELLSITYVSSTEITNDQYGVLDAVAKSVKLAG